MKYWKLLFIISVISFIIILHIQHTEKKLYEEYVSQQINNKTQDLMYSITQSVKVFEQIHLTGEITKRQASILETYSRDVLSEPQSLKSLALQFKRVEGDTIFTTDNIAKTAQRIGHYFSTMIGHEEIDWQNAGELLVSLEEPNQKEEIEHLYTLYKLWFDVIKRNADEMFTEEGELEGKTWDYYSVQDDYWINLVMELDQSTQTFLSQHNVLSIDDLLSTGN